MSNGSKNTLNPALVPMSDTLSELTADEFRRTFYAWFEGRGLLTELRAYLRKQMVDTLRDSSLGATLSSVNLNESLSTQFMNILVAEYLLSMRYSFSVSVFGTEAPFVGVFPECRMWLNGFDGATPRDRYLNEHQMLDVLELLGFVRHSQVCKKLTELYYSSEQQSLLACMVHLLRDYSKERQAIRNADGSNRAREYLSELEPWLKDIYMLLSNFDMPEEIVCDVISHIKRVFLTEQEKVKLTEHNKFNRLQLEIQKDLQRKELEISRMITELEQTFFQERQKMMDEYMQERSHSHEMKQSALKCELEYRTKLDLLEKREDVVKEREAELTEQIDTLKSRIKMLQNAYDAVLEENLKMSSLKQGEVSAETRDALRAEYEHLRHEIRETKDAMAQFTQSLNSSRDGQPDMLTKMTLERLQAENTRLNEVNVDLQRKVQDQKDTNEALLRRMNGLVEPLRRNPSTTTTMTAPPLPPAPSASSVRLQNPGAGEQPSSGRPRTQRFMEYRRTVPSRLLIHANSNSDSSSYTPTDEVLREARSRLRNLECATAEVDRSYKAFRQRQLYVQSTSSAQPVPQFARDYSHRNYNIDHLISQYIEHEAPQERTYAQFTTFDVPQVPFSTVNPMSEELYLGTPSDARRHPSTSRESRTAMNQQRANPTHMRTVSRTEHTNPLFVGEENWPVSPAQSVDSTGSQLQLHNVSISSVDLSSDYPDMHDKSPVKD